MKYDRFTERCGKGISIKQTSNSDNRSIFNALEQLAELKDKIEQGTLIELPCKVGDTVYAVAYKKVGAIRECIVEDIRIGYSNEVLVHFNCDNNCDDCFFNTWSQDYSGEWTCYGEWGDGTIPFEEFGKTVFLTREEAEKRLKELQE